MVHLIFRNITNIITPTAFMVAYPTTTILDLRDIYYRDTDRNIKIIKWQPKLESPSKLVFWEDEVKLREFCSYYGDFEEYSVVYMYMN